MDSHPLTSALFVSRFDEPKQAVSHQPSEFFWAPLCFALVPLFALAVGGLLFWHGTLSGDSLNDAISAVGRAIDCIQNAACP